MASNPMSFEQSLQSILQLDSNLILDNYQLLHESEQLILSISVQKNSRFDCPVCNMTNLPVLRKESYQTRFFNFFQFQTYIQSFRIWCLCPEHGEQRIKLPWEIQMQKQLNK